MKKAILILMILTGLVSCKKDSLLPSKLTAFVDGDTWKSITQVTVKQNEIFSITGTDATGRIMEIVIHGITKTTYNAPLQAQCTFTPSPTNPTDTYVSVTGTVILTSVNSTNISGTFDFECANTSLQNISITNGQFTDLRYTTIPQ